MNDRRVIINNLPIKKKLNQEETFTLINKYQLNHDSNILEQLVVDNLKLVLSMTKRFYQRTDDIDDLFQVGTIGLIKAINNFNTDYNLQLSTYAVPLIIGEMKRYLRDNSSYKVSRNIKDLAYAILKEKEKYLSEHNCEITYEQLAINLNVPYNSIIEALLTTNQVISIQEEVSNQDGVDLMLIDKLSDNYHFEDYLNDSLDLNFALDMLTDRENKIINLRYFLGLSQSEIGQELKISQAQVSRIEKKAIDNLHNLLK